MTTAAGPLVVRVVAVETRRSDVKVGQVLAHDALESRGETIGSMARRTGAVAGINGDYFDIGATNRPTNIVVRNGVLLQMPRNRYALAVTRNGSAHVAEFSFMGQVQVGDRTVSLDAIDRRPPDDGTSLLTPEYGGVPPLDNVTLASLQLLDGTPPLARYRVSGIADNLSAQPPGYYLAIGPGALSTAGVPNPGDVVTAGGDLSPLGLDAIATAIGGGPLILHNGAWIDDPDGPNGGEYDKRIPCTRRSHRTRRAAFPRRSRRPPGLGQRGTDQARVRGADARARRDRRPGLRRRRLFHDGRSPPGRSRFGDRQQSVGSHRTSGRQRAFSFIAPHRWGRRCAWSPSPPSCAPSPARRSRFASRPSTPPITRRRAVAFLWIVEPRSLGDVRDGVFYARHAGSGRIALRGGALKGTVALNVLAAPARLSIEPPDANVDNRGTLQLFAHAADARGYPLTLPKTLSWSTTAGSIANDGLFHAATGNARVTVHVGTASVQALVTVGSHEVALSVCATRALHDDSARRRRPPGARSAMRHVRRARVRLCGRRARGLRDVRPRRCRRARSASRSTCSMTEALHGCGSRCATRSTRTFFSTRPFSTPRVGATSPCGFQPALKRHACSRSTSFRREGCSYRAGR